MSVALDFPQPFFDFQQGRSDPSLSLIAVFPIGHATRETSDLGVDGFKTVGGFQTDAQLREEAEPMEGECFLQSFIKAANGRFIDEPQFVSNALQCL